jgi:hypothetical protein
MFWLRTARIELLGILESAVADAWAMLLITSRHIRSDIHRAMEALGLARLREPGFATSYEAGDLWMKIGLCAAAWGVLFSLFRALVLPR